MNLIPLITPAIQKGQNFFEIDEELLDKRLLVIMGIAIAAFAYLTSTVASFEHELALASYFAFAPIIVALAVFALMAKDYENSYQVLDKQAVDQYMTADQPHPNAMRYIASRRAALEMLEKRSDVNWEKEDVHGHCLIDNLWRERTPTLVILRVLDKMSEPAQQDYRRREEDWLRQLRHSGSVLW